MSLLHLVLREIRHRKGSFALGLVSIIVAVSCLVGALAALEGHDLRTADILDVRAKETAAAMKKLEDDYRKITKNMGHNVLILPRDQNLADFHADDFARRYMPEDYAMRLAESRIITVNHLLPSLTHKIRWPEEERTIILIGTRGQVPILHRDPKKPIQESVPQGTMVIGHAIQAVTGLKLGDSTRLMGRKFSVHKIHELRGNKDDITVWIHLSEAQEMLEKKGEINAILALECNCPGDPSERLAKIRGEILNILPETQVIAMTGKAEARVKARRTAKKAAADAIRREKESRDELRDEQESLAANLIPVVLLACCLWIGFLALGNARERSSEVGILRAIGLKSRDILFVFLGRAAVMGLAGALLGFALGVTGGAIWGGVSFRHGIELADWRILVAVLFAAPLLTIVATWLPAQLAARQDPASVLRDS